MVAGHKALLSLAQEQLIVVELEHRLVQAEQQRGEKDLLYQLGNDLS